MPLINAHAVADPGFPLKEGGVDLVGGGIDSRGSYVSKILYVKIKESGLLGGMHLAHPLDPPMTWNIKSMLSIFLNINPFTYFPILTSACIQAVNRKPF